MERWGRCYPLCACAVLTCAGLRLGAADGSGIRNALWSPRGLPPCRELLKLLPLPQDPSSNSSEVLLALFPPKSVSKLESGRMDMELGRSRAWGRQRGRRRAGTGRQACASAVLPTVRFCPTFK